MIWLCFPAYRGIVEVGGSGWPWPTGPLRRYADLPVPVTVPDTWQELSRDSLLASSDATGSRPWRVFLILPPRPTSGLGLSSC
jgi:hypothetical protein